jgi:hypothetical protein
MTKKITVLLSTGGHLSCHVSDEVADRISAKLAEGNISFVGMPGDDGQIDAKHLVYVNTAHIIRVDIEVEP